MAHIDMPQVLQDMDLGHKPQLLLVALPCDELDGHGSGTM